MTEDTSLSSACGRDHTFAQQLASAQAWWREAGVDCDFTDTPVNWIEDQPQDGPRPDTRDRVTPPVPEEALPPRIAAHSANWPATLKDFAAWWLADPALAEGGSARRIPPRGPARPDLMVLVAEPEAEDDEMLLSGPQGRFLGNILSAMGIAQDRVYFASVLPRHTPLVDWEDLTRAGLAELTRHHVGLVAPTRLLTFGRTVSSLLGNDPAQSSNFKLDINHGGGEISALACWDLAALLMRGKARSGFWQRWLDWTVSNA